MCIFMPVEPEVGIGPHDGEASTLIFLFHIFNNSIIKIYPYTSDFLIWHSGPFSNNFHFLYWPFTFIISMIPSVILNIIIKNAYLFSNCILFSGVFSEHHLLPTNNSPQVAHLTYSIFSVAFIDLFYLLKTCYHICRSSHRHLCLSMLLCVCVHLSFGCCQLLEHGLAAVSLSVINALYSILANGNHTTQQILWRAPCLVCTLVAISCCLFGFLLFFSAHRILHSEI